MRLTSRGVQATPTADADEEFVRQKIEALVKYLQSIQERHARARRRIDPIA
jgi:hypothetical protein